MHALVTGVAGFIGSALARRLIALGHDVRGIDSLTDYYSVDQKKSNIESIGLDKFEFHNLDLNTADLKSLLSKVDVVFHQAGQPGVRKSWGSDFDSYIYSNIAATQKLLEAANAIDQKIKIVYASSSSVYGDALSYPTSENDVPRPMSPYGVTKLAAEHLVSLYAQNYGLDTVSLRYFTVYGPGQRPDMAFNRFLDAALNGRPIPIFGNGEQIRDFTYVDDIVAANIAAAECGTNPGSVFNVAGGTSVSVNETIELLSRITSLDIQKQYSAGVSGDVYRTGGATDAIRNIIGWKPQVTLEEGLHNQYRWAQATLTGRK
ncbi:NAD-dependent epimerase/dehydratase family protein [Rhodococcoides fascians A25f]|uniref:NAD-dependent epimerase/dehydratase family protein n=1 Tax=Rhodococcoides fascians TaxID=1828 RepID=UPI00056AD201|nr:NAD-dependent epimerase/dehydratase family protein [Rhodococcus fascians]QII08116.1 NAD-dependent epimerase/dehydratase family protein [Rhodococcus fascians A25f]